MEQWTLADPDEQLTQIVRKANCRGPQHLVLNDGEGVVVLSETEYAGLIVETLVQQGADSQPAGETGLSMFTALRRSLEEGADGEDAYWPWDWDWEKREWVPPADHALSS